MQWKTATLSAAAGAAVTVAVYEGRAAISVGDRDPVVVGGGESVTVPATPAARAPARDARGPARRPDPAEAPGDDERVQALELENAMLRGQLALLGGARAEWPEDAPSELRPEVLEPWLRAAVGQIEGVEMERLDCEEFPCIAVMRYDAGRDASTSELNGVRDDFVARLGEGANSHVWLFGDEHAPLMTMSFGVDGLVDDPAVATRLDTRVKEIHEQVRAEAGAPE